MTTLATRRRPAPGGSTVSRPARSGASSVGRPGFAWALPATIFFALFALVPLVAVAVLSFTSWSGLGDPEFVGLDNWKTLIADPVMLKSLWLSLLFIALGVVTQTPLSILLGVWAAGNQRNRAVLSAIYFIPLLLSSAAISVLWRRCSIPTSASRASCRGFSATATCWARRRGPSESSSSWACGSSRPSTP
ncbi:carbohydrate ABC transporter permease [Arthrobacter sedimenti]|uniref:carbohydrate ABC transporter permease n=1 Tax=Arthrobacter sedimenti TaxID=2694931 RepID=UPI001CDC59D5|nr:hypothetical protein [Arthrobacter sedimenti]